MSDQEISKLSPAEINEAVAKKLEYVFDANSEDVAFQWIEPHKSRHIDLPDFCGSIEAAWEIVEWLHQKGDQKNSDSIPYGFRLEHHTENSEDKWLCELPNVTSAPPYEEMNSHISIKADTAPMAICLAFLKLNEK